MLHNIKTLELSKTSNMHSLLEVFKDCSMYMYTRTVILERLTQWTLDFHVHLIFYQFRISLGSILESHLHPQSSKKWFQGRLIQQSPSPGDPSKKNTYFVKYKSLWIFRWFKLISIDFHRFPWISVDFHGFP